MHENKNMLPEWDSAINLLKEGNKAEALFLFRRMVMDNRYSALVEIGNIYEMPSCENIDQNFEKAAAFYRKSIVKADDVYGYRALGRLYYFGVGVEQNFKKAFELFTEASKQGCMVSDLMQARMYKFGQGVPKNINLARNSYSLAIGKGSYVALKERGWFDMQEGRLFSGLKDFLRGSYNMFKIIKSDMTKYGFLLDERAKEQ